MLSPSLPDKTVIATRQKGIFVFAKTTAPPMDDGQRDRFSKSLRSSCCGVKAR